MEDDDAQQATPLEAVEEGAARVRLLLACDPFALVASDALRAASDLSRRSDELLRETVGVARSHGASWADVGAALGISRQAAFQRFASSVEKAPAGRSRTPQADPALAAERIFERWGTRDWAAVRDRFSPGMLTAVTESALEEVWTQVRAAVGSYSGPGRAVVRRNGSSTIVELTLIFEDGSMSGRVSFDREGTVTGLLILDPALHS